MTLREKGGRVQTDVTSNGFIRETLNRVRPIHSDHSMNAHFERLSECQTN
jgi:hypothetical protein